MKICIITKLLPFFMKQLFSLLSDLRHFSPFSFLSFSPFVEMNYYRKFSFIRDNKVVGDYCSALVFISIHSMPSSHFLSLLVRSSFREGKKS
jgi:hypothetical protein